MVFESGRPIAHVARDIGIHHETLRKWVRPNRSREGTPSVSPTRPTAQQVLGAAEHEERKRLKALERENRELRRVNEIPKSVSAFFAAELDPRRTK